MTGHDSFVLPLYIPQDVDMAAIKAQVAAEGVSAPAAVVPGLLDVVNQAHAHGIHLKIVLLDHNPPNDTPLRDISTVVGADYRDATVLTLSPSYVGTYSTQFPRVTLEAGEDIAKTGNPVVSAQHFVNELETPEFPWTGLTIFLLVAVLASAVGARLLQLCAKRSATPQGPGPAGLVTPTNTA
ncbi:Rv1476 family membrane protein [Mycobacterium sp. 050134]|uniref:Rv1476 family membrane protein n=1 Tax=Mycobacterium sp. 050134 TaxID=3096111 RepID=UPI002EDB75AB